MIFDTVEYSLSEKEVKVATQYDRKLLRFWKRRAIYLTVSFLIIQQSSIGYPKKDSAQNAKSVSSVPSNPEQIRQECLEVTKKVLGEHAKIVKYGKFNDPSIQEAVVIVPENYPSDRVNGVAVLKMAILRYENFKWHVALLAAGKNITNEVGSVGIQVIDDSMPFWGYRINIYHERDDGKKAFELGINFLEKNGNTEGLPIYISFNSLVGRYQEFDIHAVPPGFQAEIKKPRHFNGH